jgi:hypothetical protein
MLAGNGNMSNVPLEKLLSKAAAALVLPDDRHVDPAWKFTRAQINSIQICGSLRTTGGSAAHLPAAAHSSFATAHQLLLIEFNEAITDMPELQHARVVRIERFNFSEEAGGAQQRATDVLRIYGYVMQAIGRPHVLLFFLPRYLCAFVENGRSAYHKEVAAAVSDLAPVPAGVYQRPWPTAPEQRPQERSIATS